jgi:hypothetical protein
MIYYFNFGAGIPIDPMWFPSPERSRDFLVAHLPQNRQFHRVTIIGGLGSHLPLICCSWTGNEGETRYLTFHQDWFPQFFPKIDLESIPELEGDFPPPGWVDSAWIRPVLP